MCFCLEDQSSSNLYHFNIFLSDLAANMTEVSQGDSFLRMSLKRSWYKNGIKGCQFDSKQKRLKLTCKKNWKIWALQQPKSLEQPQTREDNFSKQDVLIWLVSPKIQQLLQIKIKFQWDDLLQVCLQPRIGLNFRRF